MHLIAKMYNIYYLLLYGGHVMPVAEMRAPVVGFKDELPWIYTESRRCGS